MGSVLGTLEASSHTHSSQGGRGYNHILGEEFDTWRREGLMSYKPGGRAGV